MGLACQRAPTEATASLPRGDTQPASQPLVSAQQREEARMVYAARCQVCHGPHGAGNGPMAVALRPPPRSFADADWQRQATEPDIAEIIVRGGAAVGRSAAMPAAPDLIKQPGVVAGLVGIVREFGAPGGP